MQYIHYLKPLTFLTLSLKYRVLLALLLTLLVFCSTTLFGQPQTQAQISATQVKTIIAN